MRILGVNNDMFISSAALVEDGRITAAAAEERFTRQKQTRAFPLTAAKYCLRHAGASLTGLDAVAVHWNPGAYMNGFNPLLSARRRFKGEYLYSVPDYLMRLAPDPTVAHIDQRLRLPDGECRILYVTHHRAHAANAFFLSPFDAAAVFTADAQGELESTTWGEARDGHLRILQSIDYPQSLGMLYASMTEHLGFQPNSDEWKVMALASYADADNPALKLFREMVRLRPEGRFEVDLSYFRGFLPDHATLCTPKVAGVFGPARTPEDPLTERHYEIAAALQRITEEAAFHALTWLHERTKRDDLVVAGGLFMNCVLNARIPERTPFRRVFVSSCPDDSGNAMGAALWAYHEILGGRAREPMTHNFLGPEFSDDEIRTALQRAGLDAARRVANVEEETARRLADGQLVGWFQGRMEFGQRALGNRSILADPRPADMKDRINRAVKYREPFRPFAPSVLEEHAEALFEMPAGGRVPFMEKAYPVKPAHRAAFPAVVHVDGTARLQTVDRRTNPRYHRLIGEFHRRTGIPLVLNTSFNVAGEPIVHSPQDAIRTFFSSGLDVLVLGDHVLTKRREP